MYRKWFPHLALAIALLASLLAGMLPVAGLAQSPEQPAPPGAGVQDALLAALAEEGATAGFFVVMAEQADLGPAYEIEDWQARGEFVYETLRETAARSQAPVIAYAQDRGLAYRSFLTNNAVYIEAGDLRAVDALARLPGVAQVRLPEVATVQPSQGQSPEASPDSFGWNLDSLDPTSDAYGMQAAQVWQQYGITGEGIVVANIDTGAYYQHVALDRQYRGNTTGSIGGPYEHDFSWYQPNYIPCGNGTFPCDSDYYGHGTGTIGIMTGETPDQSKQIGVAPGAKWISCMGCDDPPYCTEAALTACADWMVAPCPIGADPGDPACDPDKRPHVVNNSWGGGGCSTWYQPMVQAWTAAGIFPAFAAGNAGGCGTVASPGDLPESFGVAAHWTNGDNAYSGGPSCFYPTPTCDPDAHDIDPHVNAPTGGETAANSQATYSALGGTSGASPHVAGAVALLWSANPGLIGQIEATFTVLEQSANRDRPATFCGKPACAGTNDYPNYDFGWGYLDALAAVQMAGAGGLGELEGTVTEASPLEVPGDPLPDVAITAQRQGSLYSLQAQTGVSGYYSTTLPAGTYTVTADGPFHGPETVTGLSITTGTLSIQDFQLLPKGRLHGYVTEAEGGTPLEATVRTAEVDPVGTDPATGLYSIYLGQGSHDVIVEANNYASQTVPIDIVSGQEITQDFALVPALDVAPWPIQASVELSGTLDVSTVITNRTAAAYDMSLSHAAARAGDEGPILLVDDENLEENPAAFAIALSNLGYDYVTIDAQAFVSSTITELLNYGAVIYAGTAAAGAEQKQIIAYLDAGGRFLLADGSFTLYHQDSRLHRVYLQAIYDGLYEWAGPQTGLDIMAGLYPDISSAVVVYDSFAGPEGVGIFQAASSNFSGIRTARAGYRAIYLSFDLNRIGAREPGDADETAVVYPAMLWLLGYPVEAPWYSTDVSGGVVPANSSLTFASEFSTLPATGIDQPGEFYAQLHVEPAAVGEIYPRLDVPVQLTVLPRPTMGRLAGTITSDRPTGPMAAPVTIEDGGGGSWTTTSDWWTGGYGYWLDAGNYTVSIVADGYYTETAQVTITAGMTTTQDFAMILAAPEISVSPATMEEALSFGETATRTLQIGNSGPEKLVFDVNERDRGVTQLPMSLLEATPEGVDGARILFDAYHGGNATYYTELLGDLGALGATVDIWSSGYITASALAGYDILFIGDYLDVEYRFDELDAIDAFVRDGGGLFVTYECCDDTTAPRVTKMFDIVYIGEGGTGGTTHDIYPHPTTRGVGAIYIPSPQYLMTATVTGTAEIIVYDVGGDPALAVNEVGNGKVLVMPDDQLWDGVYDQADNTQLGRNIFGWLYGDVPWVASVPVSGTIATGEALTLTVTFDAGAVDEPAIYYGDLILPNNDPLAPSPAVSLTLTVEPAADQGRLMGTVTSDRPGGPLAADVLVEDGEGVTLTLYSLPSTGEYHRWLTGSVYTLTASATGYVTQTAAIEVPAGGSAVLDFELALDAPAATALPGAVEETVVWGMTATRRLTVGNTGLQDLDFDLVEEDLGWVPGIEQASPAFGFDYENDNFVTFPVDDPGNWTIVAPVPYESYDGGDFWWNDLNTIYVIKGSYLYTVDPATGEDDYLAHIGQPYPHRWTSLTIAEDGTLYGVTDYW
ncbi:MAG: S8 family serine peptidase, partial [Anaerolineae bacterium]